MAMIDKVFLVGMFLTLFTGPLILVTAPAWACFIMEMKQRSLYSRIESIGAPARPDSSAIVLFGDGF